MALLSYCSKWPSAQCFNIFRAEQLPTDFQLCSECAALVHLEKEPSDRFSEQFLGIGFSYKSVIELVPWPHTPSVRPMAQSFGITHGLLTLGPATRHR